jgi:hypothetical protein
MHKARHAAPVPGLARSQAAQCATCCQGRSEVSVAATSDLQAVNAHTQDDPSALVRLPVEAGAWAESLPPVPERHRVTLSFSSAALRDEHGDAVELLGYVLVASPSDPTGPDAAWLVVPAELARSHPRWWSTIRKRADAVYHLGMGPVLRRFASLLDAHGVSANHT